MDTDVIIVGAGISGLVAARSLQKAGLTTLIVDKSRGLGGRMATRRIGQAVCDHGAQYFTVENPEFMSLLHEWVEENSVQEWFSRSLELSEEKKRYIGYPSMTGPAKHLAKGLEIRRESLVTKVAEKDRKWVVELKNGEVLSSRAVLLTAPVPQALSLVKAGGVTFPSPEMARLEAVAYDPCLALMVVLSGPSGLAAPGYLPVRGDPVISCVTDNLQKGISPVPSLTVHTTADFAEAYWEAEDNKRIPLILDALRPYVPTEVVETSCHRWKYSLVSKAYGESFFADEERGLFMAGDGFLGPRVECAVLSGLAVAEKIGLHIAHNRA